MTKQTRLNRNPVCWCLSAVVLLLLMGCDDNGQSGGQDRSIGASTLALSEELVVNGDFSSGASSWYLGQYGGSSSGTVTGGEYRITVSSAGSEWWHVQFQQGGIPLEQGKSYIFSFDARKGPENGGTQIMQINVGEDGGDYTSYFAGQGHNQEIPLTTTSTHYSYTFTMNEPNDPGARVEFNCGRHTGTYYLDNVSIMEVAVDESHLAVSPGSVDFGPVTVGGSGSVSISLSNDGGVSTTVLSITSSNGLFTHNAPSVFTVAAGGTVSFYISFSPVSIGNASGVLTIESNAADNPILTIPLSGTGVEEGLEIGPASMSLTAAAGETAAAQLTLSNTSSSPISWSIAAPPAWLSVSPANGTLAGGASSLVTVTGNAGSLGGGIYNGVLAVTHNAGNLPSPYNIPVAFEVTEGYQPVSAQLIDPELAIDFVEDVAAFRIQARDNAHGGFYTFVDQQGNPTGENMKSLCGQSRLGYAFVRSFMLTGDESYLDHAHHALKFLYDHGYNNGWYFVTDINGNYISHWGHDDWWSFQQHYALVGISAMVEATGGNVNWGDGSQTDSYWLNTGVNSNYNRLWDSNAATLGYFEYASTNWSNKWGKGFTPTVDGITTHAFLLAAMTDNVQHDNRFFQLADNIVDHMVGNMSIADMGFPEYFNSDWSVDYGSSSADIGHHYKTSWVLQRAYLMDTSRTEYNDGAQEIMWDLWDGGGYDKVHGGPYSVVQWPSGNVTNTDKNHWMVEQGVTAGLINYYVATDQSDKDMYLEVADGSLRFYMDHLVDPNYGDTYTNVSADGNTVTDGSKGGLFTAGYHSVELGYYVYLYGNLYYHGTPATLYYRYPSASTARQYKLTPVAIEDSVLKILAVSKDGAPYTSFDPDTRVLSLPAGTGGVFEVTFGIESVCGDGVCGGGETCSTCEEDCGVCGYCGDGACNGDETCATCEADCGPCEYCGDGICNNGETCSTCEEDCGSCGGVPLPARLEAEDYVRANETSSPGTNEGGACDRGDGVDMELTGDTLGGNCNVGWTATGEWLEFDIDAGSGGIYDIVSRVATDSGTAAFNILIDGASVSGNRTVPRQGWQVYSNITVSDVTLSPGPHVLRITFTGYVNLNWIDMEEQGPCIPTTCAAQGAECGAIPDGCGNTLSCGSCGAGEVCNVFHQCDPEPYCGDGICNNGETCATCEADCGSCGGGCTCPIGCNAVVNASVPLTVDGFNNKCYFFNNLGSYINSWNSNQANINGVNITNIYMGSWDYPAKIDGGYYIYHRSTLPWGHIEVK